MKVQADKNRSDRQFEVGDQVLLKLQPYTQSSVASRPFPKLAYKFFGPYKILERICAVAYKLELPAHSEIHPVFHISQLKPFTPDYTPVFSTLPEATEAVPEQILQRRLVKKGNTAVPQVLVTWSGLPATSGHQLHGKITMCLRLVFQKRLLGVKHILRPGVQDSGVNAYWP